MLKAKSPKYVLMIKHEVGSIYLLYPAPTFDNKIDIEKEDILPFILALITVAEIEEPPTVCDTIETRILQSLYRIKHELNKQDLKAKEAENGVS